MGNMSVKLRREHLLDRMLEGVAPAQLRNDWMYSNNNKTLHSYEKDVTWCYKKIQHLNLKNIESIYQHHLLMYDENIRLAREVGNINAANQAMQFKEKLLGLHKPDVLIQNNTQQNVFKLEEISVEDLKILLNESNE